jgi:choline kinase
MAYDVCILAAGMGTRVTAFNGQLHKALLPLGNRAVLSRIMQAFPDNTRFVIALGHRAEQIRDYLAMAHPDADVTFVTVENVDGPGSGPGTSLRCCRDQLPGAFVFTSCDTLIDGDIPPPDANWIGVQKAENPERWCTVECDDQGRVVRLHDKSPEGAPLAFVGIAGVSDAERFWAALGTVGARGEVQVAPGLEALIPAGLKPVVMSWMDTGTDGDYANALKRYEKNYTFEGKTTDVTYRLGDRVVKLFFDPTAAQRRLARGRANAGTFVDVLGAQGYCCAYRFVHGAMLSKDLDAALCRRCLDWLQARFWKPAPIDPPAFAAACRRFYVDKTLARLDAFLTRRQVDWETKTLALNRRACPPAGAMIAFAQNELVKGALASTFHGDLHADNVLVSGDSFTLIDWRDDFAGLAEVGDRYYDLAKFFHTLDLSVEVMESGDYHVETRSADAFDLRHRIEPSLEQAQAAFWSFAARHGYSRFRIDLLNGVTFLNMAPLYDLRMGRYLYLLGRMRLAEALADQGRLSSSGELIAENAMPS